MNSKFHLYLKSFILAILTSLSLHISNGSYFVNPQISEELGNSYFAIILWQINNSIRSTNYIIILYTIIAFFAFKYLIPKLGKKHKIIKSAFSVIFAFFILLCESYHKLSSWDCVFGSKTALTTSAIKGLGIAILAYFVIDIICSIKFEASCEEFCFSKKQFLKLVSIMIICWLPYIIIMAPGCANADTRDQFGQFLGIREMCWTFEADAETLINNHHPVFHTFILGCFLKIGEAIGSCFVGIQIFCVLQSIAFACVLTYSVLKMRCYGASKNISKGAFILFSLCPLFPLWAVAIFKDTPFIIALLLTIVLLYDALKTPNEFNWKKMISLMVVVLFLMLVRNNGLYIMLGLLPFVIIGTFKNKTFLLKIISVILIPIIVFTVGYTGILFNAFGIKGGSTKEMLSIPFQQTARYISEYENEVTPKEQQAILRVIGDGKNLNSITSIYVPDRSDNVKATFHPDKESYVNDYIKVWAKQLTKHPTVYIEAFLNMNYSWFCFDSKQDNIYYDGVTDKRITEYIDDFKNPESFSGARATIKQIVYILAKLPLINCLFEFSFYTWAYVILFIIILIRGKRKELLCTLPIYINYAICFLGPVAYMRYAIPMVCCLPFVIYIVFSQERKSIKESKENIKEHEIWIK